MIADIVSLEGGSWGVRVETDDGQTFAQVFSSRLDAEKAAWLVKSTIQAVIRCQK